MGGNSARSVVGGQFKNVMLVPPVALVDAIEFYHAGFDHYFMSADSIEINALDTGYFTGWARTGYSFKVYVTGSSPGTTLRPVCRYYGLPSAGLDSHFYSASAAECWQVNAYYGTEWQIESDNVFQIALPNTTTGACPAGTIAGLPRVQQSSRRQPPLHDEHGGARADGSGGMDPRGLRPGRDDHVRGGDTMN